MDDRHIAQAEHGLRTLLKRGVVTPSTVMSSEGLVQLTQEMGRGREDSAASALQAHAVVLQAIREHSDAAVARALFGIDDATAGTPIGHRREAAAALAGVKPESFRLRRQAKLVSELAADYVARLAIARAADHVPTIERLRSGLTTARTFPFGVPDGTPQVGSEDPLKNFVQISGKQFVHGLGMSENDFSARVIVGRKGAGKTLYLRRLQRAASTNPSLYADAWQTSHPPTSDVIRVYDLAGNLETATELWERLWKVALLRSVASHLLCAPRLRSAAEPIAEELGESLSDVGCAFRRPSPPSDQVQEILFDHTGLEPLARYLSRPAWRLIEAIVKEALAESPPVCLFLDALDDHFEQAPKQWLACQLGLCRLVLAMAEQFPRLHVVIAIRDLVYSALQSSEHRMRYLRTERIRLLDWNYAAISRLLDVKIDQLPDDYLLGSEGAVSKVECWLGLKEIPNVGKGADRAGRTEDAEKYLLRHTRLIPRDLVQLGNAICSTIDAAADSGHDYLSPEEIRQAVRRVARDAGTEELLVVANHITTTWMPRHRVQQGNETAFISGGNTLDGDQLSVQQYVRDHLRRMIRNLQHDRVTRKAFQGFLDSARAEFGEDANVGSMLWQHGLVGYIDGPRLTTKPVFYSATDENEMTLASDHEAYAFHPILTDAVPLTAVGAIVQPY